MSPKVILSAIFSLCLFAISFSQEKDYSFLNSLPAESRLPNEVPVSNGSLISVNDQISQAIGEIDRQNERRQHIIRTAGFFIFASGITGSIMTLTDGLKKHDEITGTGKYATTNEKSNWTKLHTALIVESGTLFLSGCIMLSF